MREIQFIDTTLRDGHQSLWATRMSTAHMYPVIRNIDDAGYKSIELMGTVHFDACLRYLRENPWERINLIAEATPNTPIRALIRSKSLTSFNIVPDSIIELWVQRCAANGIDELMIFDALHDWDNLMVSVSAAKASGIKVIVPLVYSLSPVHTDEFYVQKTIEMIQKLDPDIVLIKDSIGLLTIDSVRSLIPKIKEHIGDRPLEMHSHCSTGLAPVVCLESVKLGVDSIYTCAAPLANGSSHPSIECMTKNLRRLGYNINIDESEIKIISNHFEYVAKKENKPIGAPVEFDVFQYMHQVPGGMISNLKYMLEQRNMQNRMDEVLDEISIIYQEWGYPVMITPFSQLVATQAVLNVFSGKRYKMITDEAARYVLGHYGKPPVPIEQNVIDKVLSLPEGQKYQNWEQPQPSINDYRKGFDNNIGDDELLLRVLFPKEHVNETLAAGPIKTDYVYGGNPIITLIEEVASNKKYDFIEICKDDFTLKLES